MMMCAALLCIKKAEIAKELFHFNVFKYLAKNIKF